MILLYCRENENLFSYTFRFYIKKSLEARSSHVVNLYE